MRMNWLGWVAGAAASLLFAGAANADGMGGKSLKDVLAAPCCEANWNGLYIGGAIGYGVATTEVGVNGQYYDYDAESWSSPMNVFNLDGLSGKGVTGTISLGYDRQVHPGLVVGVFGDYTFGDLDTDISLGISEMSGLHLGVEVGDQWAIGARIGLVRSCCTMWYVMAGYAQGDLSWGLSSSGYSVAHGSKTLSGYFAGLGVEQQLGRNLSLKLEYRYTNYDGVNLFTYGDEDMGERINVKADTDVHAVRLGVNWKFDLLHRADAPAPLK